MTYLVRNMAAENEKAKVASFLTVSPHEKGAVKRPPLKL
jgi:hypothetical protein